jgi:hypothetical protein
MHEKQPSSTQPKRGAKRWKEFSLGLATSARNPVVDYGERQTVNGERSERGTPNALNHLSESINLEALFAEK